MGASNYPGLGIPKPQSPTAGKRAERKAEEKRQRQVYAAVDLRDGLRCIVTGRRANTASIDPIDRLHHHHILQRGRDCGPTETWNIASVHAIVHEALTRNTLTMEGDADDKASLVIAVKASAVEEVFGRKRVPVHVRVVLDEFWLAWLNEHAGRQTRRWR